MESSKRNRHVSRTTTNRCKNLKITLFTFSAPELMFLCNLAASMAEIYKKNLKTFQLY